MQGDPNDNAIGSMKCAHQGKFEEHNLLEQLSAMGIIHVYLGLGGGVSGCGGPWHEKNWYEIQRTHYYHE